MPCTAFVALRIPCCVATMFKLHHACYILLTFELRSAYCLLSTVKRPACIDTIRVVLQKPAASFAVTQCLQTWLCGFVCSMKHRLMPLWNKLSMLGGQTRGSGAVLYSVSSCAGLKHMRKKTGTFTADDAAVE